uniref:C-type lectin domain-containing protein n=1 Tax=Pelodiscus sinensis TaxID=13735 RepID=K7FZ95_PELSI
VLSYLIPSCLISVLQSGCSPAAQGPACPDGWVGYQGKCFYFSEAEGNWTYSRSRCSALGSSLTAIDTLQEMDFLLHHKDKSDYWIGLRRDQGQPWKWTNGTKFNHLFGIEGGGECAYLNENRVGSLRCTGEGRWICSKPDVFTCGWGAGLEP